MNRHVFDFWQEIALQDEVDFYERLEYSEQFLFFFIFNEIQLYTFTLMFSQYWQHMLNSRFFLVFVGNFLDQILR